MDTRNSKGKFHQDGQGPLLRTLNAGDAASVIGSSGSVVRVLQGRTWITQEGDARDYVVPAGMSFCAARKGSIVATAVADDTRIAIYHVSPLPAADWTHNRLRMDPDFTLIARREAQREIARYVADWATWLWRRLRRTWLQVIVVRRGGPLRTHGYHG